MLMTIPGKMNDQYRFSEEARAKRMAPVIMQSWPRRRRIRRGIRWPNVPVSHANIPPTTPGETRLLL